MTEFLFPDNTVLCDFAAVDQMDLLRSVLDGRGRWTEAVTHEARKPDGRQAGRHVIITDRSSPRGYLIE